MLQPPANQNDLSNNPQLSADLLELWNDATEEGRYLGAYIQEAVARSGNYVDPNVEPPAGTPAAIPWNGFPRLLSRWYDDELSDSNKEQAEATAEVATPILTWIQPFNGQLMLFDAAEHHLPFYAERLGSFVTDLARFRRSALPNGTLGDEIPRFRRQQDEYLEWHATHDSNGRLVKLTFTAEPPDYWEALAETSQDRVHELYEDLLGRSVPKEDLFFEHDVAAFGIDADLNPGWFIVPGLRGRYNNLNRWTTTDGIVHLTHRANTLGAEVILGADSSRVFASDNAQPPTGGVPLPPEIRRIACGEYGGINRSSDPLIGNAVGGQVKQGRRVTLTDPVGLYVAKVDLAGLRGPQDQPVGNAAVEFIRGQEDAFEPRILRFEVRLPDGTAFGLDECTLDGRPLVRGGQVARRTTMQIYASIYQDGGDLTEVPCSGQACRNPSRSEHFLIGAAGENCPTAGNSEWLLQTPLEQQADSDTDSESIGTGNLAAAADGADPVSASLGQLGADVLAASVVSGQKIDVSQAVMPSRVGGELPSND